MAGRTDADYGLVPVKSRVSLSSRPVPPFYNKGNESNLSKQDLSYLFLRHCKLRVESVFVSTLRVFFRTRIYSIDTDASLILVLSDDVSFVHYGLKAQRLIKR